MRDEGVRGDIGQYFCTIHQISSDSISMGFKYSCRPLLLPLELVLPEKELKMKNQTVVINRTELRRAAIHILISIIALPLHFQTLPIRDITGGPMDKMITFAQLKPRLINILMNALQVETDPQNTHMLLGGLLLSVQDSVTFEETEHTGEMVQLSPPASDMNLLSSGNGNKKDFLIPIRYTFSRKIQSFSSFIFWSLSLCIQSFKELFCTHFLCLYTSNILS
uniref:Uncharacterized protein n=1 Tax=Lutzomyia longipalpis TaxID=7200 RepID=A0A1B0CW32_LUTLO